MSAHSGGCAAPGRGCAVRPPEDVLAQRLAGLGAALDDEPDPAFRATTRARLVAMAAVRSPRPARPSGWRRWLTARPVESPGARRWGRMTAGLAGAAVAVTALAGLVAVSTGAQPGDPLYGLKRSTEQTHLALAGDSSRGQTLLGFASTRLRELDHLLAEGTTALPAPGADTGDGAVAAAGADPALVIETLRTMDAQTAEGATWLTTRAARTGTSAPLDFLSDWALRQSDQLAALAPKVPEGARDAVSSSLTLLHQVDGRSTALRDALACPGGPATAGADDLGPRPAACTSTPPPSAAGSSTADPGAVPSAGQPTPEAPATTAPTVPAPSTPGPSSGPGGSGPGGSGPGGSGGAAVPTPPRIPLPTSPSPGLPLPSLPAPIPGATTTSGSTSPSSSPPPPVSICLGPIAIGNC